MALSRGTKLGVYELTGPIGAGGMGEVYRARDSRLQRDVAGDAAGARTAGGLAALLAVAILVAAPGHAPCAEATATDNPIDRLLHDYIALYTRDTLDEWRTLFHPAFVAAFTNDDGSTTARTLDQFLERQRNYFASGRPISEELKDVKVARDGPLASVRAGFVLHDGDTAKEGRLMMLLIRERDRYLIQSLVFTYHLDAAP